jgi:hypothetical protein
MAGLADMSVGCCDSRTAGVLDLIRFLGRGRHDEILPHVAWARSCDVQSIALALRMPPAYVSRGLREMMRQGLVAFRCDKKRHVYSLGHVVSMKEASWYQAARLTIGLTNGERLIIEWPGTPIAGCGRATQEIPRELGPG